LEVLLLQTLRSLAIAEERLKVQSTATLSVNFLTMEFLLNFVLMLNSSFLTRVLILNGDQKLGQIFFAFILCSKNEQSALNPVLKRFLLVLQPCF